MWFSDTPALTLSLIHILSIPQRNLYQLRKYFFKHLQLRIRDIVKQQILVSIFLLICRQEMCIRDRADLFHVLLLYSTSERAISARENTWISKLWLRVSRLIPVSYTHLDVYKRQFLHRLRFPNIRHCHWILPNWHWKNRWVKVYCQRFSFKGRFSTGPTDFFQS